MKKFIVTVDYQDTQGNPKSRRVEFISNPKDDLIERAIKITKATRKVMKIVGGDMVEVQY